MGPEQDEVAARPRPVVSRRDSLGVAGLGISTLVLPAASAAATTVTLAPTGTSSDLEGTWTARTVTSDGEGPDGADQGVKGIATNGSSVFWRRGDASTIVREVALDGTFIADHAVTGASTANIVGNGSEENDGRNELAVSAGYLFTRSASNLSAGGAGTSLYAMRITSDATWSLTDVTIPADRPLLAGRIFMIGNLLDLPDGRLGVVSAPSGTSGAYTSTLRLYTVDTSAAPDGAIVLTWSEDITLPDSDTSIYPGDCHGVASDGTFLHRLDYNGASGYRSRTWELPTSGSTATRASAPGYTATSDNPTYMARNHVTGDYLIGNFQNGGTRFFTT